MSAGWPRKNWNAANARKANEKFKDLFEVTDTALLTAAVVVDLAQVVNAAILAKYDYIRQHSPTMPPDRALDLACRAVAWLDDPFKRGPDSVEQDMADRRSESEHQHEDEANERRHE